MTTRKTKSLNQYKIQHMQKIFSNYIFTLLIFGVSCFSCIQPAKTTVQTTTTEFRAPAYPLITIDPYTSAWSETDQLFDSPVRHWTGKTHSLIGTIRVDGQVYRFMGKEDIPMKTLLPMANEEAWDGKFTNTDSGKRLGTKYV